MNNARQRIAAKDGRYARLWGLPGPSGVAPCVRCPPDCKCKQPPASLVRRWDEKSLWPGAPGIRFNASLLAHGGGYLLAYREAWAGSNVWLGRLDADFNPRGSPWQLDLRHPAAPGSREDPRLFRYRGRVGVAFAGAVATPWHTNMLYALLGEDLQVAGVYAPSYPGRNLWEKNWAMFEADGDLLAVYHGQPHRILCISGTRASLVHSEPGLEAWSGGDVRGGASPVLRGGEYYHWFHDVVNDGSVRTYRMGLYTFDAQPPYRPRRLVRAPLLCAPPRAKGARVVYPCGAVPTEDGWVVSLGVNDEWVELHRWKHDEIEARLEAVA